MKILSFIIVLILFESVPFKPVEEFDLKLDFQFKQRQADPSKPVTRYASQLPYLYANLSILKLQDDEARVKIVNNLNHVVLNKKLDKVSTFKLDLGYTDDLKGHVTPHHYFIYFLSAEKTVVRKIEILFEQNGAYLVNGEKRGKL